MKGEGVNPVWWVALAVVLLAVSWHRHASVEQVPVSLSARVHLATPGTYVLESEVGCSDVTCMATLRKRGSFAQETVWRGDVARLSSMYIIGSEGDDALEVDCVHGIPVPLGGLWWDGAANHTELGDVLRVVGYSVDSVRSILSGPANGTVEMRDGARTHRIHYDHLEPVVLMGTEFNLEFVMDGVSISGAVLAFLEHDGAGKGLLWSADFENQTFTPPTNKLSIVGNSEQWESLHVKPSWSSLSFTGALSVTMQPDDSVAVDAPTLLNSELSLKAGLIELNGVTFTGGSVTLESAGVSPTGSAFGGVVVRDSILTASFGLTVDATCAGAIGPSGVACVDIAFSSIDTGALDLRSNASQLHLVSGASYAAHLNHVAVESGVVMNGVIHYGSSVAAAAGGLLLVNGTVVAGDSVQLRAYPSATTAGVEVHGLVVAQSNITADWLLLLSGEPFDPAVSAPGTGVEITDAFLRCDETLIVVGDGSLHEQSHGVRIDRSSVSTLTSAVVSATASRGSGVVIGALSEVSGGTSVSLTGTVGDAAPRATQQCAVWVQAGGVVHSEAVALTGSVGDSGGPVVGVLVDGEVAGDLTVSGTTGEYDGDAFGVRLNGTVSFGLANTVSASCSSFGSVGVSVEASAVLEFEESGETEVQGAATFAVSFPAPYTLQSPLAATITFLDTVHAPELHTGTGLLAVHLRGGAQLGSFGLPVLQFQSAGALSLVDVTSMNKITISSSAHLVFGGQLAFAGGLTTVGYMAGYCEVHCEVMESAEPIAIFNLLGDEEVSEVVVHGEIGLGWVRGYNVTLLGLARVGIITAHHVYAPHIASPDTVPAFPPVGGTITIQVAEHAELGDVQSTGVLQVWGTGMGSLASVSLPDGHSRNASTASIRDVEVVLQDQDPQFNVLYLETLRSEWHLIGAVTLPDVYGASTWHIYGCTEMASYYSEDCCGTFHFYLSDPVQCGGQALLETPEGVWLYEALTVTATGTGASSAATRSLSMVVTPSEDVPLFSGPFVEGGIDPFQFYANQQRFDANVTESGSFAATAGPFYDLDVAPTVLVEGPSPVTVVATVKENGVSLSPPLYPFAVKWDVDGDSMGDVFDTSITTDAGLNGPDTITVFVELYDAELAAVVIDWLPVVLTVENVPPTVVVPQTAVVTGVLEPVTLTGFATDPFDSLMYEWVLDSMVMSTTTSVTWTPTAEGVYTWVFSVFDGTVTVSESVTVTAVLPNVEIALPTVSCYEGETCVLAVTISVDGSPQGTPPGFDIVWTIANPGAPPIVAGGYSVVVEAPLHVPDLFAVPFSIEVVQQGTGLPLASASASYVVLNRPPLLAPFGPYRLFGGEAMVVCGVTAVDTDPLTFHWALQGRGTLSSTNVPDPVFIAGTTPGTAILTLEVSDGEAAVQRTTTAIVADRNDTMPATGSYVTCPLVDPSAPPPPTAPPPTPPSGPGPTPPGSGPSPPGSGPSPPGSGPSPPGSGSGSGSGPSPASPIGPPAAPVPGSPPQQMEEPEIDPMDRPSTGQTGAPPPVAPPPGTPPAMGGSAPPNGSGASMGGPPGPVSIQNDGLVVSGGVCGSNLACMLATGELVCVASSQECQQRMCTDMQMCGSTGGGAQLEYDVYIPQAVSRTMIMQVNVPLENAQGVPATASIPSGEAAGKVLTVTASTGLSPNQSGAQGNQILVGTVSITSDVDRVVSDVYEFSLVDPATGERTTEFSEGVVLEFVVDASLSLSDLALYFYNTDREEWEVVDRDLRLVRVVGDKQVVSGVTSHFSTFAVLLTGRGGGGGDTFHGQELVIWILSASLAVVAVVAVVVSGAVLPRMQCFKDYMMAPSSKSRTQLRAMRKKRMQSSVTGEEDEHEAIQV